MKLLTLKRKVVKPILRHNRAPKKRTNHARPGCIYAFYDAKAQMTKIGLSRTPKIRRYYLSREYNSELKIVAAVFIFNMAWGEDKLHKKYDALREFRYPKVDGFTEWFRILTPADILMLKISLFWTAFIYNAACLFLGFLTLQVLWFLVFR